MDYGKVLRRAVEITWRYRVLWAFGVLFALFSGGGAGNQSQVFRYSVSRGELRPEAVAAFLAIVVIVILVLIPLSFAVRYISRAALISMVRDIEATQSARFGDGLRAGASRTLTLLGISFVFFVPSSIVSAILIGVGLLPLLLLLGAQNDAVRAIAIIATVGLMLLVVGLLILLHAGLAVLREFVDRQCVLHGMGVTSSIRSGWAIVRSNASRVALLWLIVVGIGLAWGTVMLVVLLVLVAMVGLPVAAVHVVAQTTALTIATAVIFGIVALAILVVLGGIYEVFRSTLWTLAYLDLTPQAGEAA